VLADLTYPIEVHCYSSATNTELADITDVRFLDYDEPTLETEGQMRMLDGSMG